MYSIEKLLKDMSEPKPLCYNLAKMISLKNPKLPNVHNILEKEFNMRKANGLYGVFLIDEKLGRGTDFPTSYEIEANGGIFEITDKVYSSKTEEQIIARVARLKNKG